MLIREVLGEIFAPIEERSLSDSVLKTGFPL